MADGILQDFSNDVIEMQLLEGSCRMTDVNSLCSLSKQVRCDNGAIGLTVKYHSYRYRFYNLLAWFPEVVLVLTVS